jgi:hypothetical protein
MNAPTMRYMYLNLIAFLADYTRSYLEAMDSTRVIMPWAWVKDTEVLWQRK